MVSVVSFKDIPSLISKWKPTLDLTSDFKLKLCGDHGQEFFKVTLHILSAESKANSTSDMQVVCAAQVPEHPSNLAKLYSLEWYQTLSAAFMGRIVITNDFKVSNQLVGIMIGKYPCIYCEWNSSSGFFIGPQMQRTYQNISDHYITLQQKYNGNSKDYGICCM